MSLRILKTCGTPFVLLGILWGIGIALGIFASAHRAYEEVQYIANLRACMRSTSTPCLAKIIVDTIQREDLRTGMRMVQTWYSHVHEFRPGCDALTRGIGRALADQNLDYTRLTFTPESAWCNYGIYHGFVEVFLTNTNYDLERTRAFCEYVGGQVSIGAPGVRAECFRAIGYGIATVSSQKENSLPRVIATAVNTCQTVTVREADTIECISGIFSELGRITAETPAADSNAELHVCDELTADIKKSCYASMKWLPFITFKLTNVDTTTGFAKLQHELGDKKIVQLAEVVQQLIWTMSYNDARRGTALSGEESYSKGIQTCEALPYIFRVPCVQAFAFGLAKGGTPGRQYHDVIRFCKTTASISQDMMRACPDAALVYLQDFYPAIKNVHMCREAKRVLGATC